MLYVTSNMLAWTALGSAGVAGIAASQLFLEKHRATCLKKQQLEQAGLGTALESVQGDIWDKVLAAVREASQKRALGVSQTGFSAALASRLSSWCALHVKRAGLKASEFHAEAALDVGVRLGLACAAVAGVVGAMLSLPLALIGCMGGAAFGVSLPFRAVLRRERQRAVALEHQLSEMLEVVALGLRSGLSFDRSFQLYCEHFTTSFAHSCEQARRMWVFGLSAREDALRELAASYNSSALERVVESIVRSLRFGSSLAEVLEQAAADARQAHRAHVQEQVAKAPVKMMIPTGTLILPAMLLLVLGPVLLELIQGF